jgi:hypothetical protein
MKPNRRIHSKQSGLSKFAYLVGTWKLRLEISPAQTHTRESRVIGDRVDNGCSDQKPLSIEDKRLVISKGSSLMLYLCKPRLIRVGAWG